MLSSFFKPTGQRPEAGEYELVQSLSGDVETYPTVSSAAYEDESPKISSASPDADPDADPDALDTDALGIFDHRSQEELAIKERKLRKRIDRRLMPCLFAMIVLNYLDRNALANARIQGIEISLSLKGSEFNTAISVFFVGYFTVQVPSNMLLTRVRPSLYLPGCMIAWGFLSAMTGFVKNFKGLIAIRFLLGIFEAPFFPGALYLLSSWYTKKELAFRTSILYAGSLLSGGLGGAIAAIVQEDLDGAAGRGSWSWLFIINGSATVFLAICVMFILPDYPNTTRFLTPEERTIATNRLRESIVSHGIPRSSLLSGLVAALRDYKLYLLAAIILTKTSASAITSFIPTIISALELAHTKSHTLLLVAPPYIVTTIVSLLISHHSDKGPSRSTHIIIPISVALLGFLVNLSTTNPRTRYGSLFLILGGLYGSYNVALAWISSTLPAPASKRAAALALINTIGNLAQIYAPYLYLKKNGPRYVDAMLANAGFCLMCICATFVLRRLLMTENDVLDMEEREREVDGEEVVVEGEIVKEVERGMSFRYVL